MYTWHAVMPVFHTVHGLCQPLPLCRNHYRSAVPEIKKFCRGTFHGITVCAYQANCLTSRKAISHLQLQLATELPVDRQSNPAGVFTLHEAVGVWPADEYSQPESLSENNL